MAKTDRLQSVEKAMEGAALKEEAAKKDTQGVRRITQKEGSKQISLKKFPEEWADRIGRFHAGALSDYILIAVAEKMKRDGI